MSTHRVPGFAAPPPGRLATVTVGGRVLAVTVVDGRVRAFDDACTHLQSSLSAGVVEDGAVVCPRHLARFDVASGDVLSGPPRTGLRTFPAELVDGTLHVELPDEAHPQMP
jgi:nitrite reductase/ring-hydroxylating ferredoxin subunit